MPVYVALMRGINVGGSGTLAMQDLVALCQDCGFEDVKTYIQSGNVLFRSRLTERGVTKKLAQALAEQMRRPVSVLVRTADELRAKWRDAVTEAEGGTLDETAFERVMHHFRYVQADFDDDAAWQRLAAAVAESSTAIGSKNAEFVLRFLASEGISCAAQDLGGLHPRRIQYYPSTGRVVRRLLQVNESVLIAREEKNYASRLSSKPTAGDIELFED